MKSNRRLIAMSKIAKKRGLYVTGIKLGDNNFVTGQERREKNPHGLNYDEMTGKKVIEGKMEIDGEKVSRSERFQFVINPEKTYNYPDRYIFENNSKGDDEVLFILTTRDNVAPSLEDYKEGTHDFYIENVEEEVKNEYNAISASVQAFNTFESKSEEEKKDILDYLHVVTKDPKFDPSSSSEKVRIQRAYIKTQENPKLILDACSKENRVLIHVSKIIKSGIIRSDKGKYFEGKNFIAKDFSSLVSYYQNNIDVAGRWDTTLARMNNDVSFTPNPKADEAVELKDDIMDAILDEDKDKLLELYNKSKEINNESLNKLITKRLKQITDIIGMENVVDIAFIKAIDVDETHLATIKANLKQAGVLNEEVNKLSTKDDIKAFIEKL